MSQERANHPVWYAALALALLLFGSVTWLNLTVQSNAQRAAELVTQTNDLRFELARLLTQVQDIETGARGYVLTGAVEFLAPFESGQVAAAEQLRALRSRLDDPLQQRAIGALESLVARRVGISSQNVRLRRDVGFAAAQSDVAGGQGQAAMDAIRAHVDTMDAALRRQLRDRAAVAQTYSDAVRVWTLAGSGTSFVLLAGLFAMVLHENRLHQRTHVALRTITERFRALVVASARMTWRTNAQGVVVDEPLSDWEAFVGQAPGESLNNDWGTFVHPDDAGQMQSEFAHGVAGNRSFTMEFRARRHDGIYRDLISLAAPVMGADGHVREWIGSLNDVTEKKEAAAALRRAHDELGHINAQLAQASRLKDEFLANMSHELRTPLNAILGLSEALLEQRSGALTPRQFKSLTTILTSGQHLLSLINDILDLSKVEAGKLDLRTEPLDLNELCQACLAFVKTQALRKQIAVSFECDSRLESVQADPRRVKQILVNLLTNAVKFTPEGGRIGLTVAPEGEGGVRYTVWDTGIGISETDQRTLFTAFSQIDSGLARSQEGTGLGLALVARLVELQGGSITLESEPGKGSRFMVTLPQLGLPSTPAVSLPQEEDRRGYQRVLVIEDDPTAGAIVMEFLADLGLAGVLQTDGAQALETAIRERPDVILLDVLMPHDSGWVVLTRLKEHAATREIPVVVVSVVDEPDKSRALGATMHFTKPVTRDQLADFFQRPRLQAAPPAVRPAAAPGPAGACILLAEDNQANIQTVGGYLEDKGYAMHYALNGQVAVKLARELHPALILMDIQMPVMDGLTAIRDLRADAQFAGTPIIALTALAMPGDRERCLAAGATDYITKPVALKALAELVARLVPPPGGPL